MVGTLIAAGHPELVRTLTVTGSGFSSAGYVAGLVEDLVSLPSDDDELALFAALYAQASPDGPEHFPEVWDKVRTMWAEQFDWTDQVERIQAPTLVIVGDDDFIRVEHAVEFSKLVDHGQLAVVPGTSHALPMEKPDPVTVSVRTSSGCSAAMRVPTIPPSLHPTRSTGPRP